MQTSTPVQFCRSRSSTQFHSSITPFLRAHLHWPWSVGLGNGLALPATPQLRNHHKIHHRKADQAGQEALLHDTAHQPPWIQLADHQLSSPKNRHLYGKGREGETPFRCTETKHSHQSADDSQSADPLGKATRSVKRMDGDTSSIATAKPSRTRKQP